MKHHTVKSYDKDLHRLDELISKSSHLVLEMFKLHSESFNKHTPEITKKIYNIDLQVNLMDKEIGEHAMVMLATRQPVAIDLRHIISALRMSVIIERMGDISKHIVERSERLNTVLMPAELLDDIQSMNKKASYMLHKVLSAYEMLDTKQALEVIKLDLEIDKIYSDVMDNISFNIGTKLAQDVNSLMQLTICIKNIERLGDYIKKLAQIIYYIATGEKLTN
jgi:phosphate transport system protein